MTEFITILLGLGIGYLSGSIPFGLILTKMFGSQDIRTIGSGNIGATNVLRTGSKKLAAATLIADMAKGAVPVLVVHALALHFQWGSLPALFAGLGALLGHIFPVWLKFKGGKGVATYLGVLLVLSWLGFLGFALAWLIMAFVFRYSSLAALVAVTIVPFIIFFTGDIFIGLLLSVMSIIVILKHHENIGRLLQGQESKIGANK